MELNSWDMTGICLLIGDRVSRELTAPRRFGDTILN
jgi:hypothetical protein